MARAQISIDPGSMSDPPFLMFLAQMRTYQDSLGVCHLSAKSHLIDNPQNQGPLCSARVWTARGMLAKCGNLRLSVYVEGGASLLQGRTLQTGRVESRQNFCREQVSDGASEGN